MDYDLDGPGSIRLQLLASPAPDGSAILPRFTGPGVQPGQLNGPALGPGVQPGSKNGFFITFKLITFFNFFLQILHIYVKTSINPEFELNSFIFKARCTLPV